MNQIIFEDRAVAFIDVLGFSALVTEASHDQKALNQLQSLVGVLESVVPTIDQDVDETVPADLIPAHIYISDSIILSALLSDSNFKSYNGLEIIVMRAIQLTHRFLGAGYLLRGGISIGKVWHGTSNIVGPAYQETYKLEQSGDEPCIILSDEAEKLWLKGVCGSSRMCIRHNSSLMVNGLHNFYIPGNTNHGVLEETYECYFNIVENNINSSLPQSAKDKWSWFKKYLEDEQDESKKWSFA